MSIIVDNMEEVRARIAAAAERSGRSLDDIQLVVVTKTQSVQRVLEAINAGAAIVGENRVQEALEKYEQIGDKARWHLIGHLQKNKVKKVVPVFEMIHSVDSLELAQEIDRQAEKAGKVMDILLQINVSGEESKFGLAPGQVYDMARQVGDLKNVNLCGLMSIPAFCVNSDDSRPYFRQLAKLKEELTQKGIKGLKYLSMGMSNDFEVAIEEGANFVRVGSAIFGARS